jgi:hypothetical protein
MRLGEVQVHQSWVSARQPAVGKEAFFGMRAATSVSFRTAIRVHN